MAKLSNPFRIFLLVLMLTAVGLVMVYSSSAVASASRINQMHLNGQKQVELFTPVNYHWYYLQRQLAWVVLGILALMLLYGIGYDWLLKNWKLLCAAAFVLLLLVYVPGIGREINGARRWVGRGPFMFQPSELAKFALIIGTAKMLSDTAKVLGDPRNRLSEFAKAFFPLLLPAALFVVVIGVEDFGSAFVLGLIVSSLWFIGGVRLRHLAALFLPALAVGAILIVLEPYRLTRIIEFLTGKSWHVEQALIAVGSGGWIGRGPGLGMQKHHFLPAVHTDFAFANVCEEFGFIGALVVLLLFAVLCAVGFRVAYKTPDFGGVLLASGMTLMIVVPVLVNVAVVLGCVPTKGLALPLISYGGSSLLINLAGMGLLMNVARRNGPTDEVMRYSMWS